MEGRIDWAPALVAVGILRYHGVRMCMGGEAAFAYYNALFIDYDEYWKSSWTGTSTRRRRACSAPRASSGRAW
ncbi:hypothetical protein CDD83_1042 [Cordyceps sp. RAO-2017]|nr:hypothetical protein CDD83_1042 [Cordyceps sp. RAO-2017]